MRPTSRNRRLLNRAPLPLESFHVKKGFRIELAVLESMVSSRVAMAFDENGRYSSSNMRDYPDGDNKFPTLAGYGLLEDADGDGVFDSSHIYADNLPGHPRLLLQWRDFRGCHT